jgi:REP element-mobilizing transposase RayT
MKQTRRSRNQGVDMRRGSGPRQLSLLDQGGRSCREQENSKKSQPGRHRAIHNRLGNEQIFTFRPAIDRKTHMAIAKPGLSFGGDLLKGSHPKTQRPLDSKLPIHVTLRGIRGGLRTPKAFKNVSDILRRACKRHGVTMYSQANVGNHIHMVIKLRNRRSWSGFIRELTGEVARLMRSLGVTHKGEKFWRHRPFTRVIAGWRRPFKTVLGYIRLNQWEALGFISRQEVKTQSQLKDLLKLRSG